MLNRFRHIVEEMRGLIDNSRSASYLLAVSGGVDSMCLADLWVRAFGADGCAIAHCNFTLRGEDSDADEALVTRWAGDNGVLLHKASFNTVEYASENGLSIEMAARELRYRWFSELCNEYGYEAVFVAHHADDNAETLVLNMVRGAGLKGLTGMKQISTSSYGTVIARPLLTFTRKQIEGHAFAWKVPYREDSTNASVEYRRNSIRHEVFPLFERMNPSYVRTLNREMTYLSDAATIVEDWCRAHVAKIVCEKDSSLALRMTGTMSHCHPELSHCRPELSHCHPELSHCHPERSEGSVRLNTSALLAIPQWRYLLYYILEPYGFNSATLESLEALLTSDRTASGKRFESQDHILLVERDMLVINDKIDMQQPVFTQVPAPGAYHIGGRRVLVETLLWTSDMPLKQQEGTMIMDAAKLAFPFVLRGWRNGDWMIPLGMKGKKKLSDLFTDLKYGHSEKSSAVVIVDCKGDYAEQQHVAGVLPVRLDDKYKVTDTTSKIIRITLTDNN